jgi:AcrR family transcriptional regulator
MNTGSSQAPRRRRLSRRVRESLLLEAALAQFVECRFAGSRMEDIATRAGVAKGTPYVYFSSKDALLRNVITQFLCAEIDRLERDLQDHLRTRSAADVIRRDLAGWWARVADGPASAVFKLIVSDIPARSASAAFCAAEVIGRLELLTGNVLQAGVSRKQLLPLDMATIVGALNLPLLMLCVHRHSIETMSAGSLHVDAREFTENHIRRILRDVEVSDGPACEGHPLSSQ